MGILDGRGAVVTGGGRGIGRGHCLHLAAQGAAVVVNDIDPAEANKVVDEIAAAGGKAVANGDDIASRAGAQALVARCVDEFGGIHALVNNAGNVKDRSFLKMSDDDFTDVAARARARHLHVRPGSRASACATRGRGGSIVNTVSAAHFGNFGQTQLRGLEGRDRVDDLHLGGRARALRHPRERDQPGRHDAHVGHREDRRQDRRAARSSTRRCNGPFVAWLCSDDANWVTGQIFGTGGDRVVILEQPRYGTGMFKPGGWSVEDLAEAHEGRLRRRASSPSG